MWCDAGCISFIRQCVRTLLGNSQTGAGKRRKGCKSWHLTKLPCNKMPNKRWISGEMYVSYLLDLVTHTFYYLFLLCCYWIWDEPSWEARAKAWSWGTVCSQAVPHWVVPHEGSALPALLAPSLGGTLVSRHAGTEQHIFCIFMTFCIWIVSTRLIAMSGLNALE